MPEVVDQVAALRERFNSITGFWDRVERALNKIGFDDAFVGTTRQLSPDNLDLKYLKDNVWGMMEFSADELALINSPILQRLRRISQNGFTYLTYPSAEHSRFAHTLGVAHVVKRFIGAVGETAKRSSTFRAGDAEYKHFDIYNPQYSSLRRILVHAALLHDTGHFAFSHAGENALKMHSKKVSVGGISFSEFLSHFEEIGFTSDFSECLSITLCLSPRFGRFYEKIGLTDDPARRICEIACLIGGKPPRPSLSGIANIISGQAIDADKIDYINRDARECGIPVGVDISRIFLNSSLVDLTSEQADAINATRKGTMVQKGVHFLVNSAGIDSYNEINSAKSSLYERVYLHQFTRSAEQLFNWGIGLISRRTSIEAFDFFSMCDEEALLWMKGLKSSNLVGTRLLNRNIPKRALLLYRDACRPFSPFSMLVNWPDDVAKTEAADAEISRWGPWRLWDAIWPDDDAKRPVVQDALIAELRSATLDARKLIDPQFDANSDGAKSMYLGFAPRHILKGAKEVLVRQKRSIGTSTQWTRTEELVTAENIGRALDYVFADADWLPYVRAACARTFYNPPLGGNTSTRFPVEIELPGGGTSTVTLIPRMFLDIEAISSRIGFDSNDLTETLYKLSEKGYFGSKHRAVPLRSEEMALCQAAADKYRQFSGESGWVVTKASVAAFVRQFPASLRKELLELLLKGRMLDRAAVTPALQKIVRDASARVQGPIGICRLSPNSGQYWGMLLEADSRARFAQDGHLFLNSMTEIDLALANQSVSGLVFVDDQFGSGSQASAQLHYWKGVPRDQWPNSMRDEKNIDFEAAHPRLKAWLVNGDTTLGFVFGTAEGKQNIETHASNLGLSGLRIEFANSLPTIAEQLSVPLREFLESVGISALAHAQNLSLAPLDNSIRQNLQANALGYSGACSIVVTPFNAPSHLITALWCPGIHDGEPWVPLFIRRGYLQHLALC